MIKKFFILIYFACLFISKAQNLGDLDTSFGNNGVTEYYIGGGNTSSLWKGFSGEKLTVLPDNRFFYTGSTHWGCSGSTDWGDILARFTKDGSPDLEFNNQQSYYFDYKGYYNVITLCKDGKYLVETSKGFQKMDINANFDENFGIDGAAEDVAGYSFYDFKELSDGSFIIIGNKYDVYRNYFPVIYKYTSNGILDTSFGNNGIVFFNDKKNWVFDKVEVTTIGDIFIVGGKPVDPNDNSSTRMQSLIVHKLNKFGEPINTFGQNGYYISNIYKYQNYYYNEVFCHLDGDGLIISGDGYSTLLPSSKKIYMLKIQDNGLASNFSNGFKNIPLYMSCDDVFFHNNKLYIFGTGPTSQVFLTVRFDLNGNLDNNYNNNLGYVQFPGYNLGLGNADISIQDGKLLFGQQFSFTVCAQSNQKTAIRRFYFDEASLSSDEINLSKSIKLFPNPASDVIKIKTENKTSEITLLANDGRKIPLKQHYENGHFFLDISQLSKGVYYLDILFKNERVKKSFIKK